MGLLKSILEPALIVAIFTAGTWFNREDVPWYSDLRTPLIKDNSADSLEDGRQRDEEPDRHEDRQRCENEQTASDSAPSQKSKPNIHTRILARYPFLLEILYWLLTYWIYQGARAISARKIANQKPIFETATHHALQLLSLEKKLSIAIELSVQQSILKHTPWLMPFLAQIYYSHIILGVTFLVYAYTFLPRPTYQKIRRSLALENIIAFIIFSLWRCTPPRLLPEEYGFVDILHQPDGTGSGSGSAWTNNKFQLTIAAMPSLHFGNSAFIAFCLVRFSPRSHWHGIVLRVVALLWPVAMGVTVVATANHFVLDCVVGVIVLGVAFLGNRGMLVFLPIERVLFRGLRLVKPPEGR